MEFDRDAYLREERRRERRAVLAFERACKSGDASALLEAVHLLDMVGDGWRPAMKRVAKLGNVSNEVQSAFVGVWTEHKMLGLCVGHRPTFAKALRILLPRSPFKSTIR